LLLRCRFAGLFVSPSTIIFTLELFSDFAYPLFWGGVNWGKQFGLPYVCGKVLSDQIFGKVVGPFDFWF
jgi:hypothetical protein